MVQSVLHKAKGKQLAMEPFPHIVIPEALDPAYYELLASEFPSVATVNVKNRALINNADSFMGAFDAVRSPAISENWKAFMRYHTSHAFLMEALALVGDAAVKLHPALKPVLDNVREDQVIVADSGATGTFHMQCQFGINSPVIRESSVRTAHIDKPMKIYNALLYCRADDDDSEGGDLILYRFDKDPAFYGRRTAMPTRITAVTSVPYAKNTLVLFANSVHSVHGVKPRKPTRHVRRYINFQVELEQPNFSIPTINRVSAWMERSFAR